MFIFLDHLPEEVVDLDLSAAKVTTLDKVVGLLSPSASGSVQLEGPQKVGGVFEVGADGDDLVDEVLHADDAVLAERLLNEVVGGDGSALAIDLDESSFVDELADALHVGGSPCDVGL